MSKHVELIQRLYHSFNARDIDDVLSALSEDVAWANGMEGGMSMAARRCATTGPASGPSSVPMSSR